MEGFVGVPIFYGESVAGAIALILPKLKIGQIFRDIRNSIAFLENMSDLLSSKLKERDDYTALPLMQKEREVLMDEIKDAVVSTDSLGEITYHNRRFAQYFGLEQSAVGKMVTEVVPLDLIADFIQAENPERVRNERVWIEGSNTPFFGLLSCRKTVPGHGDSGMLFTFRSMQSISQDFTVTGSPEADLTFAKCKGHFAPKDIEAARRMAAHDKNLLIETAPGLPVSRLARCIHNSSTRSKKTFLALDAADMANLETELLFGEPCRLQMAEGGTLFLQNVEQLSENAQARLTAHLKAGHDIRFLCTSGTNLEKQTERGGFSVDLYHQIKEEILRLKAPTSREMTVEEQSISQLEQERIQALLRKNYSKDQVAQILGISRATLYRKIKNMDKK